MASLPTEAGGKTFGSLTVTTNVAKTNSLTIWDGSSNKRATVEDVLKNVVEKSAWAHNGIYRGKSLGSSFTAEQSRQINAGTFDDIFIGDYWTINGVKYVVAGLDYLYHVGDTEDHLTSEHHVVVIPESRMYAHVMNDTNTTEGGYVNSKMYTEGLEQAKTTIKEAFGADHVLKHWICLCNAATNGVPTGAVWAESEVELMNESMVYGSPLRQQMNSSGTNSSVATCEKTILPYFLYKNYKRTDFWLRDIVSATSFAHSSGYGYASASGASNAYGVRPYFLLS